MHLPELFGQGRCCVFSLLNGSNIGIRKGLFVLEDPQSSLAGIGLFLPIDFFPIFFMFLLQLLSNPLRFPPNHPNILPYADQPRISLSPIIDDEPSESDQTHSKEDIDYYFSYIRVRSS